MFKDKVFHLRRDGGCWEAGWGRLRRPGGFLKSNGGRGGWKAGLSPQCFLGVQRAAPFAGVRGAPEISLFSFLQPKAASQKEWKEERCDAGWGRLRRPTGGFAIQNKGYMISVLGILILALLLSACSGPFSSNSPAPTSTTTQSSSGVPTFPTTALALRTPAFGSSGQVAPSVKVLASADPSLIVQFPLVPASIKTLFPDATALVTVIQGNPQTNDFDTMIVDVQKMPPNVKFTVFLTELSAKPFGHAEYVGDVITRGDGSGESIFHLIAFVAFAADARNSNVTSADQSGDASGIQLEHVGMWFDGVSFARKVLNNPNIPGTPFDGGGGALHAGPQAMTDGQTLSVI